MTNLGNTEVSEQEASGAGGPPDEEYLHLEASRTGLLVNQIRSSVTDGKVP